MAYVPNLMKKLRFGPMSVNTTCVYVPAWFAVLATLGIYLLTKEVARGSHTAGAVATGIFSIMPAHIMRSVAGEFDNECVAVTALVFTFYFWVRCVRDEKSWPWAFPAGAAYIYMVACWGGYVFVINQVGIHALALVFTGYWNHSTYKAYTIFFLVGTIGATFVPVVGWTPLKFEKMYLIRTFSLFSYRHKRSPYTFCWDSWIS